MEINKYFQDAVQRFSNLYRVPVDPIKDANGKVIFKFVDSVKKPQQVNSDYLKKFFNL